MSVNIIIAGNNTATIKRIKQAAHSNNIVAMELDTLVQTLDNTQIASAFKCWIGFLPPPDKTYHCWWYSAKNKHINIEINKAINYKNKHNLSFIVINEIPTHESLPNSYIVLTGNNIINVFNNIHETQQFVLDQASRGEI